ncbi:MAG: hypothetical protein KDD42_02640 [Bdellovibrionales bacterium]|nr:hypothetical protein [Bdellovibrionales bacterium]
MSENSVTEEAQERETAPVESDSTEPKSPVATVSDQVAPDTNEASKEVVNPLFDFFVFIGQELDQRHVRDGIRIMSKGVFVAEDLIEPIKNLYLKFCHKVSTAEGFITDEKASKKLFGGNAPELFYLVEGKHCIIGSLIACEVKHPASIKLPLYRGSLIETSNYLHPRDPIFEDLEGVRAKLDEQHGVQFELDVGNDVYSFKSPFLSEFVSLALNNRRIQTDFPLLARGLRYAPMAVVELLRKSRRETPKHKCLMPAHWRTTKDLELRRLGGIYFLINPDRELLGCYELRGKNQAVFVRAELDALRAQRASQQIGTIILSRHPGKIFATIILEGKTYKLSTKVLNRYLSWLLEPRNLPDKFVARFTLRDCIRSLSDQFDKHTLIERHSVPRHILQLCRGRETFLKCGNWIAVLERGEVLLLEQLSPSSAGVRRGMRAPKMGKARPHRARSRIS